MAAHSAKLTTKSQLTLPKTVRDKLGVGPGDEIEFVEMEGHFHLRKRIRKSPFDRYVGHLKHLANKDPDAIVAALRGDE